MLQLLTILCLGMQLPTVPAPKPEDIPGDLTKWIETDPPESASERWWVAYQDSEHCWEVILREGRPRVQSAVAEPAPPTPLPFDITPGPAIDGLQGRRLSIKVSDGWIVSFNKGEWGAGLWWFSPDGKERHKLAEAWINDFIPTEAGLLALEGLAHGIADQGRILRLSREAKGGWRSEDLVDLKGVPFASARLADGKLLIATDDRLLKIDPTSRKTEVLVANAFWEGGLHPGSMILTPKGPSTSACRTGSPGSSRRMGPIGFAGSCRTRRSTR